MTRIPVSGAGPPEPPAYGGLGLDGWARGVTFLDFVEAAAAHRPLLDAAFRDTGLDAESAQVLERLQRSVRILALATADQVDSLYAVAHAEHACTQSPHLWMRIFDPAACPDLVQRYDVAARGGPPLLVFFGDDRREFARWGPRPAALRTLLDGARGGDPERLACDFYAADCGASMGRDLAAILAAHAGA